MGKGMDIVSQWLVHVGQDKLVENFRGEFSNFINFSSAIEATI